MDFSKLYGSTPFRTPYPDNQSMDSDMYHDMYSDTCTDIISTFTLGQKLLTNISRRLFNSLSGTIPYYLNSLSSDSNNLDKLYVSCTSSVTKALNIRKKTENQSTVNHGTGVIKTGMLRRIKASDELSALR